jgi:hypothetical protein
MVKLIDEIKISDPTKNKIPQDINNIINDTINEHIISYIGDKDDIIQMLIDENYTFDIIMPYIVEQMQYNNYEINGNLVRSNDKINRKQVLNYINSKPKLKTFLIYNTLKFHLESIDYNKLKSLVLKDIKNTDNFGTYDVKEDIFYSVEYVLENNAGVIWEPYIIDTIQIDDGFGEYLSNILNKSELFEIKLNEYSDKTINSTIERWKKTEPKVDENIAKQLIKRFNQIKNGLSSKLDIVSLSDELKIGNNYLNIDKYSYNDMFQLINSYPENPEKIKKDAIDRFVKKFEIDKPTAQSYVARFITKRDALKFAVKDGLEDLGLEKEDVLKLIPKRLQQDDAFLDPRNWDWENFEQMLDSLFPSQKTVGDDINYAESEGDKIYDKDGIEIYKGDDINKCISYNPVISDTRRKKYGWCVTQPGNTNYDYYRFKESAPTFYFVFDRQKTSEPEHSPFRDKWHAFVIQVNKDGKSYIVTNANNDSDVKVDSWGNIKQIVPIETWDKIKNLQQYFKSIPLSGVERGRKFSSGKDLSLDEFKELSQDDKILYVQGKASKDKISRDILEILPKYKISVGGRNTTLANVAIDSGQSFPYNVLEKYESLAKRYAIFRFRHTNYSKEPISLPYVKYLDDAAKEKYLETFDDNLSFELIQKYFGENSLKKEINKKAKKIDFIPSNFIRYIDDPKVRSLYNVYSKLYQNWEHDDNFNNEDAINNSSTTPEQVVNPVPIYKDQWLKLSSTEKEILLKLLENYDSKDQYMTFLYAMPFVIKKGSNKYFLLPKERSEDGYFSQWVIIDENNKVVVDNIDGETSKIGDNWLLYGYFSGNQPQRIYSSNEVEINGKPLSDNDLKENIYENWDKYQLMVRAGIIK